MYSIKSTVSLLTYSAVQSYFITVQNQWCKNVKNWYSGWIIFVRGILIYNEKKQVDTKIQQSSRNNSSKTGTCSVTFSRQHTGQLVPTQTFYLTLNWHTHFVGHTTDSGMIFDTGVKRLIRTQINDRSQGLKHYLQSAPYSQASQTKPKKSIHQLHNASRQLRLDICSKPYRQSNLIGDLSKTWLS
jgi:hypothetical protein